MYPTPSATNMTMTRSQSLPQAEAMSTPEATGAIQGSESPKSTSSQESIGATPSHGSPESTKSQECPLSPGWAQTITIFLGHSLKSEVGQKLQK